MALRSILWKFPRAIAAASLQANGQPGFFLLVLRYGASQEWSVSNTDGRLAWRAAPGERPLGVVGGVYTTRG
jgi:hypothetical protein